MRSGPSIRDWPALCVAALTVTAGCAMSPPAARSAVAFAAAPPVVCPRGGQGILAGSPLQPALDAAPAGAVLCLSPGRYRGPIVIRASIQLQGPVDAVVESSGQGTTVSVLSPHATLLGFTVDGSGDRFDTMDAAVYVRGDDITVRHVTVRRALFGIVAERSSGVVVDGNHIVGDAGVPAGLRGDGVRFWEVRGSSIVNNLVEDSRDLVVWYSPGNVLTGNTVLRSRYATHFMYASDCVVERNRYERNIVGVFIMYSRKIALRDNVIADNTAADSMGLGVKESGNIEVERNRFVRDRQCLYFDNSPFEAEDEMTVRSNVLALCSAGVTFHRSETRTVFADNRFEGNETPAAIEGGGTARGVTWRGNYFDDYQGYDVDGDGYGDVPYELRDLSEGLISRRPTLAFFRGTMALALIDVAARAFPVLQPETLLVDEQPRMTPPAGAR